MRITALLVLILALNFSNSILVATGLFTTSPADFSGGLTRAINETVDNTSYLGTSVQTTESSLIGVGDFITGLFNFIKVFFIGVVLPFKILIQYGVSPDLALYFSFPIYFIYVVGVIQFISGRYIE